MIFDFVLRLRIVFAQHYESGSKIPGKELANFLPDPGNVKGLCTRDGPFTKPQLAFMIAAAIICKSKEAARMLGACIFNRAPKKITERMKNLYLNEFL